MSDADLINHDLAPTPAEARTWGTMHIAALWIGMAVCIPTWTMASGLVDKGWTWQVAVASIALGNLVVLVPMVLNAHAGTRYGIPFPVLVRSSFGVVGANVPALLRALVACGWFGINTYIGGAAMAQVVRVVVLSSSTPSGRLPILGIEPVELICFVAFWALQLFILLRGMESLKRLESWAAPFLILIVIALLVWAIDRSGSFAKMLENPPSTSTASTTNERGYGALLGAGLTSAVSFWGTLALNIPDFSRYAKSQKSQALGQLIGLPLTMAFMAFVGAVVTNASFAIFGERVSDPVVLLGKVGGTTTTVLAMLALLFATLTTNVAANIVGPANDFSNLSPARISFRAGCVITAVIGLLIMPWRLYNDAGNYLFTWLLGYGAMLGGVAGVMIADYWLLRRQHLDLDDLYTGAGRYRFVRGTNPVAIVALVAGVAVNLPGFLGALGVVDVGEPWKTIYDWAWFVAFFVSAALHVAGMKLFPGLAPDLRDASSSTTPT
ncbi:MAG TPA: NCS1 family nucleobase:cation symporter-1, partial [Myxococcota bacterium]